MTALEALKFCLESMTPERIISVRVCDLEGYAHWVMYNLVDPEADKGRSYTLNTTNPHRLPFSQKSGPYDIVGKGQQATQKDTKDRRAKDYPDTVKPVTKWAGNIHPSQVLVQLS